MLDWLVIGGGPHGVHTALCLVGEVGVPRDAIRILDDEARLLARWHRATRNTGMRYLRSPCVHHLDLSSASLQRFASGRGRRVDRPFARPYARPALDLFDLHSKDVIERNDLQALHLRGRANGLDVIDDRVRVRYEDLTEVGGAGELEARHVVLALGAPREPAWPDWARGALLECAEPAADAAPRIEHLFDPGFELVDDPSDTSVVVIGGGISGAQVALRLAREDRRVLLVSRHRLRVEQFDSDPGWQGPMHMAGFRQLRDPDERRKRIQAARHRGSMPPDVHAALRVALAAGTIELREGTEVASAEVLGGEVFLDLQGERVRADRVLLATGFPSHRPGGPWLDAAVEALGLPCASCGFPIVDRSLRWHPRVLVTGALAELELGPVSRNLSGAQRAGERIVEFARADAGGVGSEREAVANG